MRIEQAVPIDYNQLIQDDRVHSALYTDPVIFDEEMEKIFHHGWVFVGHDSEIPNAGDYVTRQVGYQPVIMSRGKDGRVHVVRNRCAHRGNKVCSRDRGNEKVFACPYHGWVFGLDGSLLDTPQADGYGPDFDKAAHGMAPAAQVEVYRGFVFASLNHSGMTLAEHLGRATELLDRCADLSPEGELQLTAGWLKHKFKANWKMLPENDCDGYHVGFTHSSFMEATDSQAIDLIQGGGEPVVRDWGNGHIEIDFGVAYRKRGIPFEWFGRVPASKLPNYVKAMQTRYGEEKANELFCGGPPHAIIFPNLFLGELNVVFYYPVSRERVRAAVHAHAAQGRAGSEPACHSPDRGRRRAGLVPDSGGRDHRRAQPGRPGRPAAGVAGPEPRPAPRVPAGRPDRLAHVGRDREPRLLPPLQAGHAARPARRRLSRTDGSGSRIPSRRSP